MAAWFNDVQWKTVAVTVVIMFVLLLLLGRRG